jgi:hypothetical protein
MIDTGSLRELIATYERHGWLLRRVLLSDDARASLDINLPDIPIISSDIDAAWFSRPPGTAGVAWEIRYLGATPYALVEKLDENEDSFEQQLADVESRLRLAIAKKRIA